MSEISELFNALREAAEAMELQQQAPQTPNRIINVNYNSYTPKRYTASNEGTGSYSYNSSAASSDDDFDEGDEFHDEDAHKFERKEEVKPHLEEVKPHIEAAEAKIAGTKPDENVNRILGKITREDLIRGVIMSEVLGRPRALSPISRNFGYHSIGKIK